MSEDPIVKQWKAECEAAQNHWRELHKDDPCALCGATNEVSIIPYGNAPKLISLCQLCAIWQAVG